MRNSIFFNSALIYYVQVQNRHDSKNSQVYVANITNLHLGSTGKWVFFEGISDLLVVIAFLDAT